MTNYVLDVDIIVKILSFVCFPKVKQPLSVLKLLKSTDNCSGTFAGKYIWNG
jgi:hypothetical protein